MPGKSASGKTDSNGRFTLSTYDINDGAVVGIHNVSVSIEEDSENPQQAAVSLKLLRPCLNATLEIEVKAEKNEIDLKLGE
ncbi:MAG TPA: hypothetical protein VNQ76_00515 [Planctomicrobium sp.]|nr:hypothetical protein [Planctomicrobium sp.]